MSELVLNLVWLGVAVIGFAALWRARSRPHIQRHQGLAFLALGCVMFLLFPVISATDDLHSSEFMTDEAYSGQKLVRSLPSVRQAACSPATLAFVMIVLSGTQAFNFYEKLSVIPSRVIDNQFAYLRSVPDRAPPSVAPLFS